MEIAATKDPERPEKPSWRLPGESAQDARDRLRAERLAAKARAAGEEGRTIPS